MKKIILFILIAVCFPVYLYAAMPVNPSYVSPSGSGSACTEGSPCSLSYANANAAAGDVVNLKVGTYNTEIAPVNSGSSGNVITFQAHNGGEVNITNTGTYSHGIFLDGKDYIKIDGMTIYEVYRWANIRNGANYNEIANCTFYDLTGVAGGSCFYIWGQCSGGTPYTCHSTNNWVHNCTFHTMGFVDPVTCDDQLALMYIGTANYGNSGSNNNTLEDNIFYHGGHHLIETYTKYNVIRNNVFHNEGWMPDPEICTWGASARNGKYGNRNIQIYDGHDAGDLHNLVEGNRFGHAAFASDGAMDGNLTITSQGNIVRYNDSFYSETWGIYFKYGANALGADNRVYNNSLYANGQDSQFYPNAWTGYGDMDWRYGIGDRCSGGGCIDNVIKNNIIYNSYSGDISNNSASIYTHNWITSTGNPNFTDTDVSDPTSTTLPNLSLQYGSLAIDGGTYLTTVSGVTDQTHITLADAFYFQDGTLGSALAGHQGDYIAIGTVVNTSRIKSINYSTGAVELETQPTFTVNTNDPVWLHKKSDGVQVLYGSAPDYGAHEYPADDVIAPVLSALNPSGTLSYRSVQQISCASNENCTVKFGIVGVGGVTTSTSYDSLPYIMDTTGGMSHSHQLVVSPGSYTIIFQGKDGSDNKSSNTGYTTTFTIQEQEPSPELPVSAGRSCSEGSYMGSGMSIP